MDNYTTPKCAHCRSSLTPEEEKLGKFCDSNVCRRTRGQSPLSANEEDLAYWEELERQDKRLQDG